MFCGPIYPMNLIRSLLLLIIPGIVFAAALYLKLAVTITNEWRPFFGLFPYLAVAAGVFLGWRFNRTRVLWAILLIVVVERSLTLSSAYLQEYLLAVIPLLLPVNILLYAWWSERGLFTLHGAMRMAITLAQIAFLALLFKQAAGEIMAWLERPLVPLASLEPIPFPQFTLLVSLICLVGLLAVFVRKAEAIEGSFVWVLPSVMAGFWWPNDFAFWGGVACFLLTVALIESSFKMAFNDELTGLPARRAMNEYLLKMGRRYTIAMVDVDHFKKVNDVHGHDVGDQVLRMVATCLRRVSGGGRAYRYGGEEFAVIFPSKEIDRALPHLEELREKISQTGFTLRSRKRPKKKPGKSTSKTVGKAKLQVTVSIGAAMRNDKLASADEVIKAADQALYKAKRGGRNRVCSV